MPARFENQINIQNDRLRYVSTETRHGMIQAAKGEYVALLNAGLVPTKNDWLKRVNEHWSTRDLWFSDWPRS